MEFDPEAGIQEITDEDFQVGKWNFQPEQLSIHTFVTESPRILRAQKVVTERPVALHQKMLRDIPSSILGTSLICFRELGLYDSTP